MGREGRRQSFGGLGGVIRASVSPSGRCDQWFPPTHYLTLKQPQDEKTAEGQLTILTANEGC